MAGHGRVLAARKLGMTEVPCIEIAYLTDAQRRAYIIADNKLALNAGWDEELLKLELGEVKLSGLDLLLTSFSELELNALLANKTEGLTDPDDVPPAPEHPVTQLGDLWLLGAKVTCPHCRKTQPLERDQAAAVTVACARRRSRSRSSPG